MLALTGAASPPAAMAVNCGVIRDWRYNTWERRHRRRGQARTHARTHASERAVRYRKCSKLNGGGIEHVGVGQGADVWFLQSQPLLRFPIKRNKRPIRLGAAVAACLPSLRMLPREFVHQCRAKRDYRAAIPPAPNNPIGGLSNQPLASLYPILQPIKRRRYEKRIHDAGVDMQIGCGTGWPRFAKKKGSGCSRSPRTHRRTQASICLK